MVEKEVRVLGPVGGVMLGWNWVLEEKPWPMTLDLELGPYAKPSPLVSRGYKKYKKGSIELEKEILPPFHYSLCPKNKSLNMSKKKVT
jgi:hypothetical protein